MYGKIKGRRKYKSVFKASAALASIPVAAGIAVSVILLSPIHIHCDPVGISAPDAYFTTSLFNVKDNDDVRYVVVPYDGEPAEENFASYIA